VSRGVPPEVLSVSQSLRVMRTFTGKSIDPIDPHPEDFDILDVARGLSHCCRFAGQLDRFYSVAQHSCLVTRLVPQPFRLAALLHDASEAYLGDLTSGVKHHRLLDGYCTVERRVQSAIHARFLGEPPSLGAIQSIKDADTLAAIFERAVVVQGRWWTDAADEINSAVSTGFITEPVSVVDLLVMAAKLPQQASEFGLNTPYEAERLFLHVYKMILRVKALES